MKTRPVVVIALDHDAIDIAQEIVAGLSERPLGENARYPASMCRALAILPTKSKDKDGNATENTKPRAEIDRLYSSTGRVQFLDHLQQAVDTTRDSTEWDSLIVTHRVNPDPRPILVLAGCCWNLEMQEHLLKVLDAIHSLPFGRGRSDVLGLMLLPELRLSSQADKAMSQRAATFAALRTMQSVIDQPEGKSWEGWFPLDRVWLIGNNDRNGRALGGFAEVIQVLGAGLASYIADGALEEQLRKLGTDERELRDPFGNSHCYQSLGFREFVFPQERLREHLFEMLVDRSLEGYVGREPELGSDEFVLQARHFLVNDIALPQLHHCVSGELRNSKVLSEFALYDIQADGVEVFLNHLEEEAHAYSEDTLNRAKQELGAQSRAEADSLEQACHELLEGAVDTVGPRGALRLAQELVGEAEVPSLEERLPIPEIADVYRQRMTNLVGLAPPPQRTADHVEMRILQVQQTINGLKRELDLLASDPFEDEEEPSDSYTDQVPDASEDADSTAHDEQSEDTETGEDAAADAQASDEAVGERESDQEDQEGQQEAEDEPIASNTHERRTWNEARGERPERERLIESRLGSLELRLQRLEKAKTLVADRAAHSIRFWEDPGVRKKAFARLEVQNQRSISRTAKRLQEEDERCNELEREKLELRDRSGRALLGLFIILPISLAGLAIICSAILDRFYDISLVQQLNTLTDNFEFVIIGVAFYFLFATEEFFRRVYLPIVRVNHRIREAKQQCRSLREKCVRKWAEMFNSDFNYRVLDRAVQILNRLTQGIRNRAKLLSQFVARCESGGDSAASFAVGRVPGVDVLVSSGDLPMFLSLCFERDIDDEIEEILSGRSDDWRLSSALLQDDPVNGIQERLAQFFDTRFHARVGRLSVDEILSQYWKQLHPPIPPERRALSIFRLAPFVQLVDLPGESEINQHYRVSIREGSESRLFQALDTPPYPLALQPSASRERISVICESDLFSIVSVAKLEVYKEAYERYRQRKRDTPLHPKGTKEDELPVLVPSH